MTKYILKTFKEKFNNCDSIIDVVPQIKNESEYYIELSTHLTTLFTASTELYLSSIEYYMTIDKNDFIVTDMKVLKYNNESVNTYVEHTPHKLLEEWIKNPNEFSRYLNLPLDFSDCFINTSMIIEHLNSWLNEKLNKDIYLVSDINNYEFYISILGRTDKKCGCLYVNLHNNDFITITVKFFGISTVQNFEYPISYNSIMSLLFYNIYTRIYNNLKETETIMEKYKYNKMVINFINIYEDKLKIY